MRGALSRFVAAMPQIAASRMPMWIRDFGPSAIDRAFRGDPLFRTIRIDIVHDWEQQGIGYAWIHDSLKLYASGYWDPQSSGRIADALRETRSNIARLLGGAS